MINIFSAASIGSYPNDIGGMRRTSYVRPRDPGKSVGPIVVKIGTWVHFGV